MSDKSVGSFPLGGKIVLVTGGGSGICLAFVKLAVAADAKVIIADLRLTDAAESLTAEYPERVLFVQTDVGKWKQLETLLHVSVEKFGEVPDVYVAGAGLFEPKGLNFWDDEEEESYLEVQINVSHPIKLTRMAMRALISNGKKGVVLSTASTAGLMGVITSPLYCATKFAVVGFTRSLKAVDAMEGVKVVTVCPGIVDTPLWTEAKRAQFGFDKDTNSLTPEDVAQAMKELVEDGKYGGGTVLEVMPADGPQLRVVPEWNADPPKGMSRFATADAEAIMKMLEPVRTKLEDDKGTPWPAKQA